MHKFVFKLEKVLELRGHYEKEAKIELGRAIAVLSGIEGEIEETARKRVDAAAERFLPGRTGAQIFNTDLYIMRLDRLTEKLFEDAARAELVVAEKRETYIEASREKKTLDRLREKRFAEYKKALSAEEIKTVDDIANGSRSRRALEEGRP
ncbi:MAG: flagellar export protein FliJ [Spirochaetaceae bacterium]|jgi:flagellar FliJ protein|nr:flagellar export protein FliJ [Spirochaetaceae bacterium]